MEAMKPNVRSVDGLLQICYDLPYRVHTCKAYPLTAPNGSTIMVYGHEQGLRLIWRGGRPFKHQPITEQKPSKSNGGSKDMVISLDSDDDNNEKPTEDAPYQDNPVFEDEVEEYDPSEPYMPIIQTLDLPLGVEVLRLAFPHLPASLQKTSLDSLPTLMSQNLVCALACSDFTVRVLTVPLMPPSPRSKARPEIANTVSNLDAEKNIFGEQMVTLTTGTIHRSIPKGVSISMTANTPEDEDDIYMEDDNDTSGKLAISPPASRSRSRSRIGRDIPWDLLVASHSSDLSGLLLVYRIPLVANGTKISSEQHGPWRTQNLASPAVSVEFNSALYPATRHSQIIIAEAKGTVRIFDCAPRGRAAQGCWLVSLHTEFETLHDSTIRRKPILDARWALGGKSILVLLADGKYGIWDIESAGPKPVEMVDTPRPFTMFALVGWVGNSLESKPLIKSSNTKKESKSKFAPMTPGTRKVKQEALFTGPVPQSDNPARGGLFVCPAQDPSSSRADDESILLWHGSHIIVISSLFTHWQNKIRGSGNLFGNGAKGEPHIINSIQLGGESCNEIGLFPCSKGPATEPMNPIEVLVTGEHRLLIITAPLAAPPPPAEPTPPPLSSSVDQQLLARGELDVHGMDRILAHMAKGNTSTSDPRRSSNGKEKNLLMSL